MPEGETLAICSSVQSLWRVEEPRAHRGTSYRPQKEKESREVLDRSVGGGLDLGARGGEGSRRANEGLGAVLVADESAPEASSEDDSDLEEEHMGIHERGRSYTS